MRPVERTLPSIGLLVCPQTCGGVRTGIHLEGDIDPVFNDRKTDLSLGAPGSHSYDKTLDRVRSGCRSL